MRCCSTFLEINEVLDFLFFCNDTATTEIYTLSLHDALPISVTGSARDGLFQSKRKCPAQSGMLLDLEHGNGMPEPFRLFIERTGCGRGLLDERRVTLRHVVHLPDREIDLADARTLFLRSRRNLVDDRRHAVHRRSGG